MHVERSGYVLDWKQHAKTPTYKRGMETQCRQPVGWTPTYKRGQETHFFPVEELDSSEDWGVMFSNFTNSSL